MCSLLVESEVLRDFDKRNPFNRASMSNRKSLGDSMNFIYSITENVVGFSALTLAEFATSEEQSLLPLCKVTFVRLSVISISILLFHSMENIVPNDPCAMKRNICACCH